jgi:hypothetical protein
MENLNEHQIKNILTERFGEPIGKTHTGPGVADERKASNSTEEKKKPRKRKKSPRPNWLLDGGLGNWPGEK